MNAHADREHSSWSASATERNWNCSGALAITEALPDEVSEAADWGTCAHQISEKCFANGNDADAYIGATEKGKKYSFIVDEEMADTAQRYVDYCRGRAAQYQTETGHRPVTFVEERFSLAGMNPPFDAGGTSDYVLYFPKWKELEVVDLKGGRGVVVEVKGNKQARSYGLGALLMHEDFDVETVRTTIVQPRASHRDGRIRSEAVSIADLLDWAMELLNKMHRSREAQLARSTMAPAEWAAKYLTPGPWCDKTFCKAAGFCPALEQKALDDAGVWFDDEDKPKLANAPYANDPAKLARDLEVCDLLEGWVRAKRAYAHQEAESGVEIPGWLLVESVGREKFKDEEAVQSALFKAGVPDELYLNAPKLRTPKQVRDALAKKKNGMADKLALLDGTTETPSTGRTLVRADKTTRSAAVPTAKKFFADEGEATPSTGLFD